MNTNSQKKCEVDGFTGFNRRLLLFMLLCPLIMGTNALATELEPGVEYCGDVYEDLLLPTGACVIQGYFGSLSYSEGSNRSSSFVLTYNEKTLESIRFGYAIVLDGLLNSAWLLSQRNSTTTTGSLIQVTYKKSESQASELELLELSLVHER